MKIKPVWGLGGIALVAALWIRFGPVWILGLAALAAVAWYIITRPGALDS
ncbi:MAG: hypothetical protein QN174_07825 [Armatimonadota bacterium]|nr:hypothetical protein [Armatimonadota bacterium]